MNSSRLREQGFSNLYRKLIFRLLALAFAAYLFYSPNPWTVPERVAHCMEMGGVLLMFAGIIGRILATLSIGGLKDREIVKTELYSICRNPLYFASFLMAVGLGLFSTRLDFTILIIMAFFVIFYPMMLNEARFLREKFPDFAEYERRVPLFFPDFRLWVEREQFQFSFNRLKRTMLDSALILIAVPVLLALQLMVQRAG